MKTLIAIAFMLLFTSHAFAVDFASTPIVRDGSPSAVPSRADEYVIDDGTSETGVQRPGGGTVIWVNQFTVLENAELITMIRIGNGWIPEGTPVFILIFDDPNNDGDPSDVTAADLLHISAGLTGPSATDVWLVFTDYPVPNVNVGSAGDSFFIGACLSHDTTQWPVRSDKTAPQGRSWIAGDESAGADCTNPNSLTNPFFNNVPDFPGNWLVRASAIGIPIGVEHSTWGAVKDAYK